MAQWLPESWRQALTRLREDIHRALDRWLPRRRAEAREGEAEGWLPVRWSASVEQLGADIHNVLDRWLPRWRGREVEEELWPPSLVSDRGPLTATEETDDEVSVLAEFPGLDKDDFTVEIRGDRLVLRGEKRQETEERRYGYYYVERSYGAFARAIALPCEVDAGKATAKYKNGLLRITLPKTAQAKAKRITVQVR
jgi:HSP20 family protein